MVSEPQVVVAISDLHLSLGPDWRLEDFHSDAQMLALADWIKVRFTGQRVDLVLLGDIFDLWQVVPQADLTAAFGSQIDLTWRLPQLQSDLATVAQRHLPFFQALATFGQDPDNRLVIIAGNHDRPLITPALQATLKNILVQQFGFPDRGDNLYFPPFHFYHVPRLGLYAEHGNQYEKFNAYQHFVEPDPLTGECQGYGLVRLFWNRMEHLAPDIDDTPEHWGSWFSWLRRHVRWGTLLKAWSWYQDYLGDRRVKPISINDYLKEAALAVPDAQGVEHAVTPDILLNAQDLNPNLLFSNDLAVEAAYRRLYDEDPEFRQAMQEILIQKFAPGPVPPVEPLPGVLPADLDAPETLIHPTAGAARSLILGEPLVRSLEGMFTPGQGPNLLRDDQGRSTHLDPKVYHLILMGHTHVPRWEGIPNHPGKLYVNSGTWTTRTVNGGTRTDRTVILVEELPSGEIWAESGPISAAGTYNTQKRQQLPRPQGI
jgi:UDP-2,3-diacylglucosamine pyrophosphatase LpxH